MRPSSLTALHQRIPQFSHSLTINPPYKNHLRHLQVVLAGFQQPLSNAERKAKRADAQRMGKGIVTVQLGQKGLTETFLKGLADALAANELVKVRTHTCGRCYCFGDCLLAGRREGRRVRPVTHNKALFTRLH